MNLSDPGTGKTPSVTVNQWRRSSEGKRTIWVQPKALMAKNVREILRFTPFSPKDVAIVDGTTRQVDTAMNSGAQVLLMGPDRFKRLVPSLPKAALDVDEFHMCFGGAGGGFDSAPSGRVRAFYEYTHGYDEGVFMTGTMINGRLDTCFPAIHAIEPRYYPFGYEQFMGAHAYMDERNRPYGWHSHARIGQILGKHGIRRTFEQVFGKQAVQFELEWLDMSQAQREIYDTFHEQAYLELEQFIIDGTMPGVATIRARQIMEHPNYFRDLRDPYNLPHVDIMPGHAPAKLESMKIHLTDHINNKTPVVIFAALVPQQQQIVDLARSMGRRVGLMNGDTSAKEKNAVDQGFVSGELDTIVASAKVASVGFNWQFSGEKEVNHVIFPSLTYMSSDFIQGYRRTVRGQRGSPLRVTTQAYIDSVDQNVMGINRRKARDAHLVDQTQELIKFDSHEED